jgi:predicted TPR repeat methyltransferase
LVLEGDPLAQADALIQSGKAKEAVALLEEMHAAGRGGLLLQAARVRALIASGDCGNALVVAREAAMLYPSVATAAVSLGEALLAAGHLPAAIGEFQRALRLDSNLITARCLLGRAWLDAGEAEKAAEALAAVSVEDAPAGFDAALAEIEAMRRRPRADPRYVRHLFDQFSSDYDARMLGQLGYSAPQILRSLAELIGISQRTDLAILDLGCGTGLAGAIFHELAAHLDGIDLSPSMATKARARGIYNDVTVADIEAALGGDGRMYDLIMAADTLVYLGDLAATFRGARNRLLPDGVFLFTVERAAGPAYELGPKRRWRHSDGYLRREAERAGFGVVGFLECSPRTEAGVPVEGYAVALRLAEKVG